MAKQKADKTTATKPPAPKSTRRKATEKVDSGVAEVWKPESEGEQLAGTYLGSEKVKAKGNRDPFDSYHFVTDPDEENPKGVRYRVASAMLNNKMRRIPKGTFCWLTYVGKFETENGLSNDFEVEVEAGTELMDPLELSAETDKADKAS